MSKYCECFTEETLKKWYKEACDKSFDYLEGDITDSEMLEIVGGHNLECLIAQALGAMADNKILVEALEDSRETLTLTSLIDKSSVSRETLERVEQALSKIKDKQ